MTRQRAPEIYQRKLITCQDCKGQGVNPDYHPASQALSECCPACHGFGRIDETLGALPYEQIIQAFRGRIIQLKQMNKRDSEAVAKLVAAFDVLKKISDTPHPASVTHSRGPFGAAKAD